MTSLITQLKQGTIPSSLTEQRGTPIAQAHQSHIALLNESATYNVFGNQFHTASGLYHPVPWSSSVFVIRSLLRERPPLGHLLELGCGTGVVSLSLIQHGLAGSAVMTDVSDAAVRASAANAANLKLDGCTAVRRGSMFAPVAGEKFDTILFNMPLQHTSHDGAAHIALDDLQGVLASTFFEQAPAYLKQGGSGFFCFSNISDPALLQAFAARVALTLVAVEWVVSTGFWLLLYRFHADAPATSGQR